MANDMQDQEFCFCIEQSDTAQVLWIRIRDCFQKEAYQQSLV